MLPATVWYVIGWPRADLDSGELQVSFCRHPRLTPHAVPRTLSVCIETINAEAHSSTNNTQTSRGASTSRTDVLRHYTRPSMRWVGGIPLRTKEHTSSARPGDCRRRSAKSEQWAGPSFLAGSSARTCMGSTSLPSRVHSPVRRARVTPHSTCTRRPRTGRQSDLRVSQWPHATPRSPPAHGTRRKRSANPRSRLAMIAPRHASKALLNSKESSPMSRAGLSSVCRWVSPMMLP